MGGWSRRYLPKQARPRPTRNEHAVKLLEVDHRTFELDDAVAHVVFTNRDDGDFRVVDPADDVGLRRQAVAPVSWTSLRQVHGAIVLEVNEPGQHDQAEADGAMTCRTGCAIAVTTADCAPVVLIGTGGIAVVHAGWRGAVAGIVPVAASMLVNRGSQPIAALVGPCIQPAAYEFGEHELETLARTFGSGVVATTERGTPALDLHELISTSLVGCGWPIAERSDCTSSPAYYSHRVRRDPERQTTVAWLAPREGAER